MVIIVLEKAYDRVPKKGYAVGFRKEKLFPTKSILSLSKICKTRLQLVKISGVISSEFPITMGLHQGSTLSSCLFHCR